MPIVFFILGLLCAAFGLGCLFWPEMPEALLWLETFLKTDEPPEPSEFYRFMTRISGLASFLVGILFFVHMFSF